MANGIRAGGGGSAGRLSIDVVAEVARLEADMGKIRRLVKDASGDIAKSAKSANDNLAGMGNGLRVANDNMVKTAPSAKMAAFGMRNLAFQAQDLGVQLTQAAASGEPLKMVLMALVMQGPQIRDAFNQTGKSVGQLVGGFAAAHPILLAVIAAMGVLYGAFKLFQSQIDDSAQLDKYAASLGLTKDEMEKLTDVGVTAGDMFKGLWRTIDQGGRVSQVFTSIKTWAIDAFKTALSWVTNFAAAQYAYLVGTGKAVLSLGTAVKQAANGDFAAAWATVKDIPAGYTEAFGQAKTAMSKFFGDWKSNSIAAAKDRLAGQAAKLIDDRTEQKLKREAKEKGSLLGDILAGTFIGQFITAMNKAGPIIDVNAIMKDGGQLGETMRRQEEAERDAEEGRRRLEDFYEEMDRQQRERMLDTAHMFADVIGGGFGRVISQMLGMIEQAREVFATGSPLMKVLASAGIGGAAAKATGGNGIGGSIGGALGGKLGEKVLTKGLEQLLPGLGQFAGPLGAIAGGILGGVVGGMLKKVKKASATIEIVAGDAMQSSLTGNSSKLKKVAGAMADSLIGGLSSIADQLGGMLGDGIKVSIGQRDKTFRVDLQGLGRTKNMPKFDTEAEAVAYAIQEVIKQGAIVGLRAGTQALLKGEGDLEAQLQKALRFENVFRDLAQRANPTIASLDAIAKEFDQLIEIFDEAKASTEDYAKLQELMAIRQREVIQQAFEPIRTMLDDLKSKADAAADGVRTAYDAVIQRESDAVSAYNQAIQAQEQAAQAARRAGQQRWLDIVTDGYNEEIDRLKATIDTISGSIDEMRRSADGFRQAADRIADFVKTIGQDLGGASLTGLRDEFDGLVAAARGGDLAAMEALPDVGGRYRDAVKAGATDNVSMMRELARIGALAGDVETSARGRASAADAQVAAAQAQVEGINRQILTVQEQIEIAKAQLDSSLEVAEKTTSIEELLADMQSAQEAADLARDQMDRLGLLNDNQVSFADAVASYESAKKDRDDLIRDITAAGFADLITVQQQTGSQLVSALSAAAQQAAKASADAATAIGVAQAAQVAAEAAANDNMGWQNWMGQIPFFAGGGDHGGGLRIVGEDGPELEATGPSRVWNGRQIAEALGGGSDAAAAEIRALRQEMDTLLYQVVKNTLNTSDRLRKWDGNGVPEERNVA